MKLTVLTENTAGGKLLAEHGLSYLIEHDGRNILFDTGHSSVFNENAISLGINLQEKVDAIVLSHGHWDHGDGLAFIQDKTLITHPLSFQKRYRKGESMNIGLALTKSELEKKFSLIESEKPYYITEKIIFLGGIPRSNNFESQKTTFVDAKGNDDFVPDDSALAIIEDDELIIISGCAHSGICNTTEYAKKVSGIKRIKTIIGGFHLKNIDSQTLETIKYFQQEDIGKLYPSHCTQLPALAAFYNEFNIRQVKTGLVLS